jgi:hypothetical protein
MLFLAAVLALAIPAAHAQTERPRVQTGLGDQQNVAVTVYNNNLALVRDTRELSLPTGELELLFSGVAQQIKPETVALKPIDNPGSIQILEQNYEYDLISPQKLMEKYVGRNVRLVNFSNDIGFQSVDATLLSVNQQPVYEVAGEIYLGHPGNVVLPEIPENLIARPSLVWMVRNQQGRQTIEATYLTQGMSWRADYVITLNRAETQMDLAGWVTLDNQSGAAYENAELKVVAGEVNVAQPKMDMRGGRVMAEAAMAAPPQMQQEAFGEYHLYTLPRRTTIKENQSKQVSLLTAEAIQVEKQYEVRGQQQFYWNRIGDVPDQPVSAFLVFQNEEDNNLGMPLPAGIMRVYQEDRSGALQFSGEDRIDHTPKDEEVKIRLGESFDLVAERRQTDFTRIAQGVTESAFEITLRNHKENDVTIDVVEPMTSDWTILQASHDHDKRDAFTAVFTVDVPADGETVVTYRVRVRQ